VLIAPHWDLAVLRKGRRVLTNTTLHALPARSAKDRAFPAPCGGGRRLTDPAVRFAGIFVGIVNAASVVIFNSRALLPNPAVLRAPRNRRRLDRTVGT
jgi:hypothetical protein